MWPRVWDAIMPRACTAANSRLVNRSNNLLKAQCILGDESRCCPSLFVNITSDSYLALIWYLVSSHWKDVDIRTILY